MEYRFKHSYNLIDDYVFPDNIEEWDDCPYCKAKPKIWEYNNGRHTGCKCHNDHYDHRNINAESIMSFVKRNNGSALNYNRNELRDNWNHFCRTGEELFKKGQYDETGRW